jgi:protein JBTS26
MNQIAGHGSDYRTLDKLFNGQNNTVDDHNMWLIPFNKGEKHTITIDLGKSYTISAVRFYNYNKSDEDTLRGVKQLIMWLDKKYITSRKGVSIRKACGFVHPMFNMGQDIKLPLKNGWTTDQIVSL